MKLADFEGRRQELAGYCRLNRIRELAVFGSVLRDDFGPDSDIDLLVEFEPEAEIGFLALARMQRELSVILGRKVDLVPKDGLKPLVRQSILDSSKVVCAA
jgi:uncharacterized protein